MMADGYEDPQVSAARRRSAVFDALFARATQQSGGPVLSPWQGLAQAGNQMLGAYMSSKGGQQLDQAQAEAGQRRGQIVQDALAARAAGQDPLAVMGAHPETAGAAQQAMIAQMGQRQPGFQAFGSPATGYKIMNKGTGATQQDMGPATPVWEQPGWAEAHQKVAAAGAPRVSVAAPIVSVDTATGKQGAKVQEYYGGAFADAQKAATESTQTLGELHRLDSLLSQVETGRFAGTALELKKAAKGLGIDLGAMGISDNVAAGEAATALANEMALKLRNPAGGAGMPGAMSDADRNYLQSMVPGLAMTGPGRRELIKTQETVAKRSQQVAKMMREYVQNPAHQALDSHFFDQLQAFSDANPMFPQAQGTPPAPAAAPIAAAPSSGGANIYDQADTAARAKLPPVPPGFQVVE